MITTQTLKLFHQEILRQSLQISKKECYQKQLHICQPTFRPINNQLPCNNNPLLTWHGHLHQTFRIYEGRKRGKLTEIARKQLFK